MRKFLLKLPTSMQLLTITGSTVLCAFLLAHLFANFFDAEQLKANADLISSVYEVMGTIYAILLTFSLWGVWQLFTNADASVQKEAYSLVDLVHVVEASPRWRHFNIRDTALGYAESVVSQEWMLLKNMTTSLINSHEKDKSACMHIVTAVQGIQPEGEREMCIFREALSLLSRWLDARRARILIARGNSAKALWPLLITGAFVLFAFHGLFVAQTMGIWITMLGGTALVIGLTFYLIFTLDCPFAGSPSIDSEPFKLAIDILKQKNRIPSEQMLA